MASQAICSVEGCGKPRYVRGYCVMHYQRVRLHGSTEKPVDNRKLGKTFQCAECGADFYVPRAQFGRRECCSQECAGRLGHKRRAVSDAERFWAKVNIGKPDECWLLKTEYFRRYGSFRLNGRSMGSHRAAYILTYGEFDPALHVRHKCDTPNCVNPAHLELGTHQDNMRDMYERNPPWHIGPRGEKAPANKLTEDQVRTIRKRHAAGESAKSLGREYGVSDTAIGYIVRRVNWWWLE
jgi:hypothetical protein